MSIEHRRQQLDAARQIVYDTVIVGGGISGAVIFQTLVRRGFRVLLLEKNDFASGTSQSSAMMIWGNLIYLRNLHLLGVKRSCVLREEMIRSQRDWIAPQTFRYLPVENSRNLLWSRLAFYTYWLLGAGRRTFPRRRKDFAESSLLKIENFPYSFEYQEAAVAPSDARFVLSWILNSRHSFEQTALNYCALSGGRYDSAEKCWHLETNDAIGGEQSIVKTKCVINAAGVWTDNLNRAFGIETAHKHLFGKGVFLGIKRPAEHRSTLMIETKEEEGCLALIPWGQISLWGPTETISKNPDEGFSVTPEEIRFLLAQINRHLSEPVSTEDVVSIRCGVRPLAVKHSSAKHDTTEISREYKIQGDRAKPWISLHGGKITYSLLAARQVENLLKNFKIPPSLDSFSFDVSPCAETETFPNLDEKIPSALWCAEREMCWNLDDYLRRRTNIAQWIPRGGLGRQNENLPHLKNLAKVFHPNNELAADSIINRYQQKIEREFDEILSKAV